MITTEVILTCKENFKKQINSLRESNKNLHLSELSREWEELSYSNVLEALELFQERLDLAKFVVDFKDKQFYLNSSNELSEINNILPGHSGYSFAVAMRRCQNLIKTEMLKKID